LPSASDILKIIYAPQKAFKAIVQNPKLSAAILIAILSILVAMGSQYAAYSKINIQKTLPSLESQSSPSPWTSNTTLWASNANITNDTANSILAAMQFSIANGTEIHAELDGIGPADCSDSGSYRNLTIALQWTQPDEQPPENAVLVLNSSSTSYFYHDLTSYFAQVGNGTWGNLTLSLGPSSPEWSSSDAGASWINITSIVLEFQWGESARADISVFVDSLFFFSKDYQWLGSVLAGSLPILAFNEALSYVFYWILFTLAVYFITKIFHVQGGMKTFLTVVGLALVGWLIVKAVFIIFYVAVPPVYETFDPFRIATANANTTLFLDFYVYSSLFLPVWPIIITYFAAKNGFDLPPSKSLAVAIVGFLPYYVLFALSAIGLG